MSPAIVGFRYHQLPINSATSDSWYLLKNAYYIHSEQVTKASHIHQRCQPHHNSQASEIALGWNPSCNIVIRRANHRGSMQFLP